ncbi:MAG TPA: DNA polymerase I [Bryobacteraceae bacterium]|nr:DNA polymerase I [Bryobacteraceae bacterium]
MMIRPRLFLIDSYGFIFRANHARARMGAPPMRTSKGLSTEAVFIFHNMLRKLLTTYQPEYIAAIFEGGHTARTEQFADYKANRTEMPPDLRDQLPYVRRLLEVQRIPILRYPGFEADDVIGTIARRAEESGEAEIVIVSSDKDMLQLVSDCISMLNPMKDDAWYNPAEVEKFMGVPPKAIPDLLALKGDSIDNIPGAPGIGDKGARDLIVRFGSVEAAVERAAEVERKTYRESLVANRDQILISKKLATIETGVEIEWTMADAAAGKPDLTALRDLYLELEFSSALKDLKPPEAAADKDYRSVSNESELASLMAEVPPGVPVAVAVADAVGIAWNPGSARAVTREIAASLTPLLSDSRPLIAHDVKDTLVKLRAAGIAQTPAFEHDVMLYGFLLSADPGGCSCDALSERYLFEQLSPAPEARADCLLGLHAKLSAQVDERGFRSIYQDIDLPLTGVLARMEECGIRIDPAQLGVMSQRLNAEMMSLEQRIFAISGSPFNINSPQQLARVLYEDLKLPAPVRYGRGKSMSTAADILEDLAAEHEIARLVLEYRQLAKLKGTYIDALPVLIRPHTGRIHTTFNQTGAATGRLSSFNPNLQNIPIRTEVGREIRAAFVPEHGWHLVVADYSQIELRLLAHMSEDPVLVDSFRKGEDIHTRTAAEVFGVPPLMVTREMRSNAKAVNFGIVYGQTPFGLAQSLGIDRKEAERYIYAYFDRYSGVRRFIDDTIAEVRRTGVSKTLIGRQRPIPDMHSRNPNARGFAERTAVNTPLQGTAADLIKMAMIRIDRTFRERSMRTRLLLQVHDELVLESPPEEVEDVRRMVKSEMESVYSLRVPLVVDTGIGPNWRDAK